MDKSFMENIEEKHMEKIVNISKQPRIRLDSEFNYFDYYESFRTKDADIYELAIVAGAAPATQVSVERAFSGLRLLLHHLRFSLSEENINNILMCFLNQDLFEKIDFETL